MPLAAGPDGGANPFRCTLYSKGFAFQQRLGSAVSYSFTRRAILSTGAIVTNVDDPANDLMMQEGCRIVVEYRSEVLLSGWVYQDTGPVTQVGTRAWDVYGDGYACAWTRGWPVPGGALTATSLSDRAQQSGTAAHTDGRADGGGYYAWPTTPAVYSAETAIKRILSDNFARFGNLRPFTFATDQARGADLRALLALPQVRMDALDTIVQAMLDSGGLALDVAQQPGATTIGLDVHVPVSWPQLLTYQSGILSDGTYQRTGPTATRAILGGPGDDAARYFQQPPIASDLEARYGIAIETFQDATGATLKWPDGLADNLQVAAYYLQRSDVAAADKQAFRDYMMQAGIKALAAGVPTSGVAVVLSETDSFHYGGSDGFHVGDTVRLGTLGSTITRPITECTVSWSKDGLKVSPTTGAVNDDPDKMLAQAIGDLARAVQRAQTRR